MPQVGLQWAQPRRDPRNCSRTWSRSRRLFCARRPAHPPPSPTAFRIAKRPSMQLQCDRSRGAIARCRCCTCTRTASPPEEGCQEISDRNLRDRDRSGGGARCCATARSGANGREGRNARTQSLNPPQSDASPMLDRGWTVQSTGGVGLAQGRPGMHRSKPRITDHVCSNPRTCRGRASQGGTRARRRTQPSERRPSHPTLVINRPSRPSREGVASSRLGGLGRAFGQARGIRTKCAASWRPCWATRTRT